MLQPERVGALQHSEAEQAGQDGMPSPAAIAAAAEASVQASTNAVVGRNSPRAIGRLRLTG